MCINCIDGICQGRCVRSVDTAPRSTFYHGEQGDLLASHEHLSLTIGDSIYDAPLTGWSHRLIHLYCLAYERENGAQKAFNVYLGSTLVGGVTL